MSSQRAVALKGQDGKHPIFTFLNGDNSWLISIPIPAAERAAGGKAFFHLVSDACLNGPAITVSPWIFSISLTSPPAATNGAEVEALIAEIENAAAAVTIATLSSRERDGKGSLIDAILINSIAPDHMHEPTLRTFNPNIPVFAVPDAVSPVRNLNHFQTVVATRNLKELSSNKGDIEWQTLHPGNPLPAWINTFRVVDHFQNWAVTIVWSSDDGNHQAVLDAAHGIDVKHPQLQSFLHETKPLVNILAMKHPLKDHFTLGMRVQLGVVAGINLAAEAEPKYWFKTHDNALIYGGFVRHITRDVPRTLESGMKEIEDLGIKQDFKIPDAIGLRAGECTVLQ